MAINQDINKNDELWLRFYEEREDRKIILSITTQMITSSKITRPCCFVSLTSMESREADWDGSSTPL